MRNGKTNLNRLKINKIYSTCKKSRGVAPNTCSILSYPESWQNSKNVFPNNSNIALAGISVI